MKIFILLLIVGFVAAEYKVKTFYDLMKYHEECGVAHHLPNATIIKYKEQKYADDKESRCHIACLAKKIDLFDDEHGIKVDNWVAQVAAASNKTVDAVKPKIVACVDEIKQFKEDHCVWAYKGFECTEKAELDVIDRLGLGTRFEFPKFSFELGGVKIENKG